MNVIGFNHDPYMVSSAQQRLNNFDDEPDKAEETQPKAKSAGSTDVDDEVSEEEDTEQGAGPSGA